MEDLNFQKTELEKLIEEKLEKIDKWQKKIIETKEDVERLQEELKNINDKIENFSEEMELTLDESNMEKEDDRSLGESESLENVQESTINVNEIIEERSEQTFEKKRKNMEDFTKQQKEKQERRKRRREEKFEEELVTENKNIEETKIDDEIGLVKLYMKNVKREEKRNKKMIIYWSDFAKRYEERIVEKIMEEWESVELTESMAIKRINEEIRKELPERYSKNIKVKVMGARKAKYIVDELGTEIIGKISMDTIRATKWDKIKERVLKEKMKINGEKIVIEEDRHEVNDLYMITY